MSILVLAALLGRPASGDAWLPSKPIPLSSFPIINQTFQKLTEHSVLNEFDGRGGGWAALRPRINYRGAAAYVLAASAAEYVVSLSDVHESKVSIERFLRGSEATFDVTPMTMPIVATELDGDSAPPMPARVAALLRESWASLDPQGPALVASIKAMDALNHFPHARDTFGTHLLGTFGMLALWGQPADVRRCGLFHTAYSGDLFRFFLFDASAGDERAQLRAVVGSDAEQLTWLFGTVHRGALLGLREMMSLDAPPSYTLSSLETQYVSVAHRLHGAVEVSKAEIAKLMVVTIADYLEQLVDVNGWRDHHQVEAPSALWPGSGRPGLGLHWAASLCQAVRSHLEVVPPVFGRCTQSLRRADEEAARDAYWRVVSEEAALAEPTQLGLLADAARRNPHVGEPEVMLAQILFRNGRYEESRSACARALVKMYALGTAWDKRRTYGAWVGYARLLHVRSSRKLGGHSDSLPPELSLPPTSGGLTLVDINKVAAMMP